MNSSHVLMRNVVAEDYGAESASPSSEPRGCRLGLPLLLLLPWVSPVPLLGTLSALPATAASGLSRVQPGKPERSFSEPAKNQESLQSASESWHARLALHLICRQFARW